MSGSEPEKTPGDLFRGLADKPLAWADAVRRRLVNQPRGAGPDVGRRRPRNLSPSELGFTRQLPVRWLAPGLLVATAVKVVGATMFGAVLDKRELQAALPGGTHDHGDGDELWLDYVADVGDGFDATYSVAWLLAQDRLAVPGPDGTEHDLPRGRVLVMGGDEVYPTPSAAGYEDRTLGPYRAALPAPPRDAPTLYALPGNHDWYDGLTAFLRLFARRSPFGGWRTRQTRSYFALRLPNRWWLYAIDEQLESYLDDPQLRYFREAAKELRTGDRVVLCTSTPRWVYSAREPRAYDTIRYFVDEIVEPTGATVPLMLTGDLHHYARYRAVESGAHPRDLVTCGGGGAYLYPTHRLPTSLTVPPASWTVRDDDTRTDAPDETDGDPATGDRTDVDRAGGAGDRPERYRLATTFPDRERSRRMAWGVFGRLLGRNAGFAAVLGFVQTLLMYAFITAGDRVLTAPVITLAAATMGASIAFANSEMDIYRRLQHWVCGIAHGLAHLGLAVLGAWAWWHLPLVHLPGPLPVLLSAVVYLPVAGIAAGTLTAAYLLVASQFQVNVNELFAAQGIDDSKSFLRLHFTADGGLTVYPVGLDRVGRRWHAAPDGPPGSPWIAPGTPLRPRLIEDPLRLR